MKNYFDSPTIKGSIVIKENIFKDLRGSFQRIYDDRNFSGVFFEGVKNINFSKNISKGTIRGLHMQKGIHSETKIVFCQK